MTTIPNQYSNVETVQVEASRFITKVYGWMCCALIVTGLVALWTAIHPQMIANIMGNRIVFYMLIFGELGCVLYLTSVINRISAQTAVAVFMLYSVLNGLTLSILFLIYTADSLASTFLVTAGTFGIMSAYGYFTKRDLTSIGHLAMMALIGLIITSVVNVFLQNDTLTWIVSYAGILIFVGLTAYDTQKIKNMHMEVLEGTDEEKKGAIMGALTLYLDFINLFIFLLRIFGRRK